MINQDTICAVATPRSEGAIAIIRISGKNAISIGEKIFFFKKSGKFLKNQKKNTIHFAYIKDENKIIDEVLFSLFRAPNSYNGEDIIEISCHASIFIQEEILKLIIKNGGRLAKEGEFTLRAFLNGKMDLSQAEAVADLIHSTNEENHRIAMKQMRGGFSYEISILRKKLLNFISLIELELDFSEEDVEFVDRRDFKNLILEIKRKIDILKNSFHLGNVIKNGVPVAIVGDTNVGKSTLLNAILNENKAIISEIPGTTRDFIEDIINIKGMDFRFIDTAGLRKTKDKIEKLGIEKTFEKIKNAKIVLFLIDVKKEIPEKKILEIKSKLDKNQILILVLNKIDILKKNVDFHKKIFFMKKEEIILISAKHKKNIENLKNKLFEIINLQKDNNIIINNLRHFQALENSYFSVLRIIEGLKNQISSEFLTMDAREILRDFGEITGEITNDEILKNIFSKFCIGK
ncbi:MAG: tRNA uridine-5-carboxymethylaminomethyl(34) synthesis GTPase MnmE [Bacteroidetes bacterium 4572_128]|nr:MAG: tRNA uridine-5-carboxymethylaminomethyl(34) synthesis GTPase MnmE [Bacteroidetes bacterium 4572_128]